jgi:hypothetical protein
MPGYFRVQASNLCDDRLGGRAQGERVSETDMIIMLQTDGLASNTNENMKTQTV